MITFDPAIVMSWLTALIWPFVRIGAMFLAAPVFGARTVPIRIRVMLALLIAFLVAPMLPPMPEIEPLSGAGVLVTIQQAVIGLAMGFLMQLTFGATVLMGQTIAMSMGLGFASVVDPENGVEVPVVSQFFLILATLLFLGLDGHLLMLSALIDSFHSLPVSLNPISPDLPKGLLAFAGHVFLMALVMALPAVVAILIVNLSLGVVTRAAPQLNIFAVGFPITILVGLLFMFLSLDVMQMSAIRLFEDSFELLAQLPG